MAYAPFGEDYPAYHYFDPSFTGQESDLGQPSNRICCEVSSPENYAYDFLYREYVPMEGRWPSPDRAGLAAVDITNPQSWNRYAYVLNNPLSNIDPLGLQDTFRVTICADLDENNVIQVVDCPSNNLTSPYGGDYESYASVSNSLASDSSSEASYCGGCYPSDSSNMSAEAGGAGWSLGWQLSASTSYLGKELGGVCDASVCGLYSMVIHPINTLYGIGFLASALPTPGSYGGNIAAQMQIYGNASAWGNRLASGDPTAVGQAVGTVATLAYGAENLRIRSYPSGGGGVNLYNTPTRGSRLAADWAGKWTGGSGFHFDIMIKRIPGGWRIWEEMSGPGSNWSNLHHWQPWK